MTLVSAKEEYDEEAGVDEDPAASGSETTTSLSIAGTRGSCSCAFRSLSLSLSLSAPAVLALVGVAFLRECVRRARRLLDGRRRLHFAGPIGGDGPSIGFTFGLGT
jgi:hypothetical protein